MFYNSISMKNGEMMSLICIEGVLGVGKTTLLDRLKDKLPCAAIYEDIEANPFLSDFYHHPKQYAIHAQYTFLLLQERRFHAALGHVGNQAKRTHQHQSDDATPELSQSAEPLVICDFHPFKSLIFASVVLTPEKSAPLRQLYRFLEIPDPDLVVYLRADVHTILARLRKRNDVFQSAIDLTYLMQVCQAYDEFFRTYQGNLVTLDTTYLDYVSDPQVLSAVLQEVPLLYTDA
jgi:deoxyguanosine kinase